MALLAALLVFGLSFTDGFAVLAEALGPEIVGQPTSSAYVDPYTWIAPDGTWSTGRGQLAGVVIQRTTRGEMHWFPATNTTAFETDCFTDDCPPVRAYVLTETGVVETKNVFRDYAGSCGPGLWRERADDFRSPCDVSEPPNAEH